MLSRSTYEYVCIFCMLQLASDVNMTAYQTLDNIRSYITYLGSYTRLNLGVRSMFQTVHQKPTTFPFRLLNYINLIISYLDLEGPCASCLKQNSQKYRCTP